MTISVFTTTYIAAVQLPRLIESLRSQTDRDFEWIVMEGGSRGNTVNAIKLAAKEKYIQ